MNYQERAKSIRAECKHSEFYTCCDCIAAAIREDVEQERYACANIAEEYECYCPDGVVDHPGYPIADLIRARKDQP